MSYRSVRAYFIFTNMFSSVIVLKSHSALEKGNFVSAVDKKEYCFFSFLFCRKVQGAIVVTLTWALASHFKFYDRVFFNLMGKALSGNLSCMWTGLLL